jgi:hypothetical protein
MFYSINASVVEAITVAQAGGGEMIVAAAFFDANNKQTKPKGAVQRKGRGEERRQKRQEPRRRGRGWAVGDGSGRQGQGLHPSMHPHVRVPPRAGWLPLVSVPGLEPLLAAILSCCVRARRAY